MAIYYPVENNSKLKKFKKKKNKINEIYALKKQIL